MAKKHAHGTIPRTLKAAEKLGLETVDLAFKDLPIAQRATFIPFSDVGSRKGSICGTIQGPNGPLICYKGDDGLCVWKAAHAIPLYDDHV